MPPAHKAKCIPYHLRAAIKLCSRGAYKDQANRRLRFIRIGSIWVNEFHGITVYCFEETLKLDGKRQFKVLLVYTIIHGGQHLFFASILIWSLLLGSYYCFLKFFAVGLSLFYTAINCLYFLRYNTKLVD